MGTVRTEKPLPLLLEKVSENPLDASACFALGVELVRGGAEPDGLRYLDRSFRLDPLHILRLIEDRELEEVREREAVRRLLWAIKQDHDRRTLSGYA